MAITRRKRRELDRMGSRQLRSAKRLPMLPATALSVRRPGYSHRIRQPGSLVFAHPDLIAKEDRSNHTAPTPSSASDRIRPKLLAMELNEYFLRRLLSWVIC
jgi:hypothetical protein